MKIQHIFPLSIVLLSLIIQVGCQPAKLKPNEDLSCQAPANDTSALHPKAAAFEAALVQAQAGQVPGLVMLAQDAQGQWVGAAGWADMTDEVALQPCMPFLIASISKVFTATVTMKLVDEGILGLDQPVSQWIDEETVSKLENADQANIRQLLDHTSGIVDYLTIFFELNQINSRQNDLSTEEMLAFAFGHSATHEVGTTYSYSNTNYVLLGLIAESATGKTLGQLYDEIIFTPLGLETGYYGIEQPIPADLVRGYIDYVGDGQYVDAEWLYRDELRTGDGGIAINAYDLATFIEGLYKGQLVSQARLDEMTAWFDLPEDWQGPLPAGHTKNGLGFEYFETDYGYAVGHSGGIYGFTSLLLYFPERDATFLFLNNSISVSDEVDIDGLIEASLQIMFE